MNENKTGKYFKYAIGEIVLVVIGILIALQINNWNEGQKERKIETKILNEIYANLKVDIQNLNLKIQETKYYAQANSNVLEHLKNKTPLTDSLKLNYARLNGFGNFQPITIGYENLKVKGTDLIKNDSLRLAISQLYDFKYFYIVEDRRTALENFFKYKAEKYNDQIVITKGYFESAEPYNLNALQNNIKFQGLLKSSASMYNFIIVRYAEGIKEIQSVQEQIKNELISND